MGESEIIEDSTLARRARKLVKLGKHAPVVAQSGRLPAGAARRNFGIAYLELQKQPVGVDGDPITFVDEGKRSAHGSDKAKRLLENWEQARAAFVKVFPNEYRRALGEINTKAGAAAPRPAKVSA